MSKRAHEDSTYDQATEQRTQAFRDQMRHDSTYCGVYGQFVSVFPEYTYYRDFPGTQFNLFRTRLEVEWMKSNIQLAQIDQSVAKLQAILDTEFDTHISAKKAEIAARMEKIGFSPQVASIILETTNHTTTRAFEVAAEAPSDVNFASVTHALKMQAEASAIRTLYNELQCLELKREHNRERINQGKQRARQIRLYLAMNDENFMKQYKANQKP
jgi:hypothetical protein